MLIEVGLVEVKKPDKRPRYIPFDVFWLVWWVLFAIGLILPTYGPEPFVVFPSVLALAVVWLFGMGQFSQTLLGADLRDLKLTAGGWTVLVQSFKEAGIEFPEQAMTPEAAQTAAKEVEPWLPGAARQSVLDWTSLAAVQAVLAGCIALVGLVVGPTLTNIHWWHGWSPVSILYGASLPSGLSLLLFGLVPFIVSRFLAALRVRSETANVISSAQPAQTAPGVKDATRPIDADHGHTSAVTQRVRRRRTRTTQPGSAGGDHS